MIGPFRWVPAIPPAWARPRSCRRAPRPDETQYPAPSDVLKMEVAGSKTLKLVAGGRAVGGSVAVRVHLPLLSRTLISQPVGRGHGRGHVAVARGSEVRGVPERVDASRGRHQPVAVAGGIGHDRHRGARAAADAGAGPCEVGVTEGEHAAVGRHHEVTVVVDGGHHADNRRVEAAGEPRSGGMEPDSGYGAVVLGVAVGEDPAVGRIEPVAAMVCRGHYADNRPLQVQAPGRSVELGRAEAEDAAVGPDEPVAALARHVGVGER